MNDDSSLIDDFAELVEHSLFGMKMIDGRPLIEQANYLLNKYHAGKPYKAIDYRPLWQVLSESYESSSDSFSPNVKFMFVLEALKDKLERDFPSDEFSREIFLDYFDQEIEKCSSIDD